MSPVGSHEDKPTVEDISPISKNPREVARAAV